MNVNFSKLYTYTILFMMCVLPTALYGLVWLGIVVAFICWIKIKDYRIIGKRISEPAFLFPFVAYLFVLLGFFIANDRGAALSSLSKMLPLVLFPLLIGTASVINRRLFEKGCQLFVLATFLSLAIALIYAIIDVRLSGMTIHWEDEAIYNKYYSYGLTRVFSNWHPTYVAMFVNISLAIIVIQTAHGLKSFTKRKMVFVILIGAVLLLGLYLLDSMIGFVGFLILLLYFTLKYMFSTNISTFFKTCLIILPLLTGFVFFYFNPLRIDKIKTLQNTEWYPTDVQGKRNVLTIRMAKWETYVSIFKENWLLGTTSADIKHIREKRYKDFGYTDLAKNNYNAHNQFIEMITIYGLLGSIFFLGMLLIPVVYFSTVHPFVIPISIIIFCTFLTESVLSRQQGMLAYMLFFALIINKRLKDQKA